MIKWLRALLRRNASAKSPVEAVVLPDNERPLGHFFHESYGTPFEPFRSLNEARSNENSYVVLQGDDGGQIYVVAPLTLVQCSETALKRLLATIDQEQWACNEGDGASLFFERIVPISAVPGGMGGGVANNEIWIHPKISLQMTRVIKETLTKKETNA